MEYKTLELVGVVEHQDLPGSQAAMAAPGLFC